ncbi:hypothetical protein ACIA5D_33320 [Actinoplanes sp. NPDC051513]|uniref:hypothetical protein n=1 Tax=Actinoplanes sp. NPDC051513 TaxID=3363908 RepID=UPI0037B3DFC0
MRALSMAEGQRLQKITRTAKDPVPLRRRRQDPARTTVTEIASGPPICVAPDDSVGRATQLMREYAVRRCIGVRTAARSGWVN